jgi:hypothetical protein
VLDDKKLHSPEGFWSQRKSGKEAFHGYRFSVAMKV